MPTDPNPGSPACETLVTTGIGDPSIHFRRMKALPRFSSLIALVLALAVVLGACSGDTSETTSTPSSTTTTGASGGSSDDPLVFGKGELPETVPADFPIPEQAVVGSTMIDRTRGVTEAVMTFPANLDAVKSFYETNLDALGYTIESSSGSGTEWRIAFVKESMTGEVVLLVGASGLSSGTLTLTDPVSG